MTRSALVVLSLLTACRDEPTDDSAAPEDTGAGTSEGLRMLVGDVDDMQTTETGVSIELSEPGTYVVVLFSQALGQGTQYGYGEAAGEAFRVETPDPAVERPADSGIPIAAFDVGDSREFRVYDGSSYVTITAEVSQVTDELVIWNDLTTESPYGEIDPDTLAEMVANMEQIVLPRTRQIFGEESDVDGSGRIDLLVSYTVNQYGAVAYISGCDIAELSGCGSSGGNGGEIIYLGIPDPDDGYATPSGITETVAHELNHLVYAYHKYALNDQLIEGENVYLTEGMSALAQDLCGYNNGNQYVWAAAIGYGDLSSDLLSVNDFLRGCGTYDQERDGSLRGGAYLYLRYLFERAGGMTVGADGTLTDDGGMAWVQAFFDTPALGVDAIEETTGRDVLDVSLDFYTALLVSGRGLNDSPAYNFAERVEDPLTGYEFGVDTFDTIHGWLQLEGPPIQEIADADGEIRAGGVEYLQFELGQAGIIDIVVDADAQPRARVFRMD